MVSKLINPEFIYFNLMFKKEKTLYECTKIDKIIHQKSLKNVRIIYKYRVYTMYIHIEWSVL